MSIDAFYAKTLDGWQRLDTVYTGPEELPDDPREPKWWVVVPLEQWQMRCTDFWVDLCHGGPWLIDERYYLPDLASALDFYREGWKERQFHDADGTLCGADHIGLYSQGKLIHGLSIYGDAPGHEGENLETIMKKVAGAVNWDETEGLR